MSNTHNNTHPHPTVQPTEVPNHAHDTLNNTQTYPVVQEASQYRQNTTHPHSAVQPIEVSQYTYDTHKPSELAAAHDQTLRQHSVASPAEQVPSRVHPVEVIEVVEVEQPHDHKKHDKHDKHDKHPSPHPEPHAHPEPEHTHKPEPQHGHKPEHPHEHHSPASPTSTIESDSVQTNPSPIFGNAERRQSWSKDEMKRGVMEGLLEKGKGKQAKGGYSSTS